MKATFRSRFVAAIFSLLIAFFGTLVWAGEPVDINQASAEQLAIALQGVGPVKAQAIVDYRQSNGPFTSVDQLMEVKGIGESLLATNRELILLTPSTDQ